MKLLQAPNLKTIARTKVISTAICRYDNQAFDDTSAESGKQKLSAFIVNKMLRPVPSQGIVEQAKIKWWL